MEDVDNRPVSSTFTFVQRRTGVTASDTRRHRRSRYGSIPPGQVQSVATNNSLIEHDLTDHTAIVLPIALNSIISRDLPPAATMTERWSRAASTHARSTFHTADLFLHLAHNVAEVKA
jgi:hypothetical protein